MGNFGSDRRSDYTCIGPHVNMAARIEAACQPGDIYISQTINDLITPNISTELAGDYQLKGIKDPVSLYRVPRD